jgi:hypothetical protein
VFAVTSYGTRAVRGRPGASGGSRMNPNNSTPLARVRLDESQLPQSAAHYLKRPQDNSPSLSQRTGRLPQKASTLRDRVKGDTVTELPNR